MNLYKYFPPQRLDVFALKMVRFTQPREFNDPFESNPHFVAPTKPALMYDAFLEMLSDFTTEKWDELKSKLGFEGSKDEFKTFLEDQPKEREALLDAISPSILSNLESDYQTGIDRIGIFSMSEVWDNLQMWAHYGGEHKGFVLEFDSSHQFFNTREKLIGFDRPRRVQYRSQRPNIQFDAMTETDIFLVKSLDWIDEQEWRYLKFLENRDKIIPNSGMPIHLFRFSIQCITGIIIGCRSSDDLQTEIMDLRKHLPDFAHIVILRAFLDEKEYKLRLKNLDA